MSLWNDTKIDYSEYFEMFVHALSESPYHCILSIGDDDLAPDLPPNFELNRRASHLEILPHAALSICHGGMGSTGPGNDDQAILYCVVTRLEIGTIKRAVKDIDPNAFITTNALSDVEGGLIKKPAFH